MAAVSLLPPPSNQFPPAPDAAAVHRGAGRLRETLLRAALEALGSLPPLTSPEELLTAPEVEVRSFAHDFVTGHHDKDCRSMGSFPCDEMAGYDFYTLSVDYYG